MHLPWGHELHFNLTPVVSVVFFNCHGLWGVAIKCWRRTFPRSCHGCVCTWLQLYWLGVFAMRLLYPISAITGCESLRLDNCAFPLSWIHEICVCKSCISMQCSDRNACLDPVACSYCPDGFLCRRIHQKVDFGVVGWANTESKVSNHAWLFRLHRWVWKSSWACLSWQLTSAVSLITPVI